MGELREIMTRDRVLGSVTIPGSKSITNRALVCASLAGGTSTLQKASDSNDTLLMINGLNQLGVLARQVGSDIIVEGGGGVLTAPKFPIPVGNAGTTLRFLLSLAALARGETRFRADERMMERPIDDLVQSLAHLGCRVAVERGTASFSVSGGGLAGGRVRMQAGKSSQFLSSLMMAAPYAKEDITIDVEGDLSSASYVAMTGAVMRSFGITTTDPPVVSIPAGKPYHATDYPVEPDASGASYFIAAAALGRGTVMIHGLQEASLQGDTLFVDVARRMGVRMEYQPDGLRASWTGDLHGIDIDMNTMPDVVPTLVAMALFCEGPTRISNIAHLQFKESDRLTALVTELTKLGAGITRTHDGLTVVPAPLHGALLDTWDDHRLAMSFALIGLRVPGIVIENPSCVRKSFPAFWKEFDSLHSA